MHVRKREILGLVLVTALPLFSFPLSWLPQPMVHYRFAVALPMAAILLAGLLLGVARLALKGGLALAASRTVADGVSAAVLWPSILLLLSWLIAVGRSQRPYLSIGILPMLLADFAVFLVAIQFPVHAWRRLLWVWLSVAAVVAINGIARSGSESEFVSTVGNRNSLAAFLAASIALGVALWNRRPARVCALLLVLFPLSWALWLCRSRGAGLALGIVALLCLLWGNCGNPLTRVVCRIIGVTAVITGLLFGVDYLTREWRTEVRPVIWQSTLRMIAERPFFGHGLGTFVTEYPRFRSPEYFLRSRATNVTDHAHNELLEVAAEQGLLGLLAILWFWGAAFFQGTRSLPPSGARRQLGLGILGATIVLFIHGMLDIGLRYPPNRTLFWFLLGLLAGASTQAEDAEARIGTTSPPAEVPVWLRSRFVLITIAVGCLLGSIWVAVAAVGQPVMAQFWERRARMAEERGALVVAETNARQSLEFQPFASTVRYLLAGVLDKSGARDQAIEQCLRIEELSPDYADVTYNLGRLYLAQGQIQQALQFLNRAVQINPYNAERRVAIATAYGQLGQVGPARAHLEEALRLDPENLAARDLLAQFSQAISP